MRESNGTDHAGFATPQGMPNSLHQESSTLAQGITTTNNNLDDIPSTPHDIPSSPTSPPALAPPPATADTPTLTPEEALAELLRSLHHKVLQPREVAVHMQRYIDNSQVDLLCEGIIEYGVGAVRNQFANGEEITLVCMGCLRGVCAA